MCPACKLVKFPKGQKKKDTTVAGTYLEGTCACDTALKDACSIHVDEVVDVTRSSLGGGAAAAVSGPPRGAAAGGGGSMTKTSAKATENIAFKMKISAWPTVIKRIMNRVLSEQDSSNTTHSSSRVMQQRLMSFANVFLKEVADITGLSFAVYQTSVTASNPEMDVARRMWLHGSPPHALVDRSVRNRDGEQILDLLHNLNAV